MTEDKGGKTMTKADIVERVYEKVGFSKKESSEIVEMVFETMKETLERGERVKISGFGKFEVRYKHPRRGRNPQTNDAIIIPERYVLSFKPSQVLRNALLNDEDEQNAADLNAADLNAAGHNAAGHGAADGHADGIGLRMDDGVDDDVDDDDL